MADLPDTLMSATGLICTRRSENTEQVQMHSGHSPVAYSKRRPMKQVSHLKTVFLGQSESLIKNSLIHIGEGTVVSKHLKCLHEIDHIISAVSS